MKYFKSIFYYASLAFAFSCSSPGNKAEVKIAFIDAFEDETISQAKKGYFKALKDSGFIAGENLNVSYRNAQGDIPTLVQAIDLAMYEQVSLIATNTTLATITASQKANGTPVCMMVSPSPEIMKINPVDESGKQYLFGVYETLDYIDTAITLIKEIFPNAQKVGAIINQSEPQSVDAMKRLQMAGEKLGLQWEFLPVNNSSETMLVTEQLLQRNIDVFFALPDNTVFASFESIYEACTNKNIPIITSEAGLVKRGALAAFGADIYAWGYEAGIESVKFLKSGIVPLPKKLTSRIKVYNPQTALLFKWNPSAGFSPIDK
jgi:putative ABC transport system substrate-binding protein